MHKRLKKEIFAILVFCLSVIFFASCETSKHKDIQKDSPIGVLKTFTDAKNSKDAETMKQCLSKNTLETMTNVAKHNGFTLEEELKKGNTTPLNNPTMPEVRNEKIDAQIATIEIKRHSRDPWNKLTFVKEDGRWKMDLIKFLDELMPDFKNMN
jgi:flagellar hook-associated protein FlgK